MEPFSFHGAWICNPGVSFGFFGTHGFALNLFGFLVLLGVLWRVHFFLSWKAIGFPALLVFGGSAWNVAERVRFGCVRDDWSFFGWFVFNVADVCIFFGVFWIVIGLVFARKRGVAW